MTTRCGGEILTDLRPIRDMLPQKSIICRECNRVLHTMLRACCAEAIYRARTTEQGEKTIMAKIREDHICGAFLAGFNHFQGDFDVLSQMISDEFAKKEPDIETIVTHLRAFADAWESRTPKPCGECFVCSLNAAKKK